MLRHGGLFFGLILGIPLGSALTLANLCLAIGVLEALRPGPSVDDGLREPLLSVPSRVDPESPSWHEATHEDFPTIPPLHEAPGELPEPTPVAPMRDAARDFAGAH